MIADSVPAPSPDGMTLSDADFGTLSEIVESQLGIAMPRSKRHMLQTRVMRRARELGLPSIEAYCRLLGTRDGRARELQSFLDLATTNKTSFFREPPQLALFAKEYLPRLVARAQSERRPLRLWSAACSSGQEVWTLGALAHAEQASRGASNSLALLGSDISLRVLETAMAAKYAADELDDVPEPYRSRYFARSKDRRRGLVRVIPELRALASFCQLNLMAPRYAVGEGMDAIFLRNVLIYFRPAEQAQIVARAAAALRPGGVFCVSLTESLHGLNAPLEHVSRSIYLKRGG